VYVTYVCANYPNNPVAPTLLLSSLDLFIINWSPPAIDGGSAILGYKVYMRISGAPSYTEIYDGSQNPT
jgi:hypothetical protein